MTPLGCLLLFYVKINAYFFSALVVINKRNLVLLQKLKWAKVLVRRRSTSFHRCSARRNTVRAFLLGFRISTFHLEQEIDGNGFSINLRDIQAAEIVPIMTIIKEKHFIKITSLNTHGRTFDYPMKTSEIRMAKRKFTDNYIRLVYIVYPNKKRNYKLVSCFIILV